MTAVAPDAERWILDALAAARARALVEPPRSIGELIERGGHLYPCLNLTAIGDDR